MTRERTCVPGRCRGGSPCRSSWGRELKLALELGLELKLALEPESEGGVGLPKGPLPVMTPSLSLPVPGFSLPFVPLSTFPCEVSG